MDLDTNVVITALNFPGKERIVMGLALRGRFRLFLSWFICFWPLEMRPYPTTRVYAPDGRFRRPGGRFGPPCLLVFLLAILLMACTSESIATPDAGLTPAPLVSPGATASAQVVPTTIAPAVAGPTVTPPTDDWFNSVRDFVAIVEPWQLVHADELDYPGDTENFGFYAEAGQTYRIDIYLLADPSQPLSPGSKLTLYDFSGLELASFDRLMEWKAPSSGVFYLVAAARQNDDYELVIIPECVIDHTVREGSTKDWAQDSAQEFWRALGPAQVQRLFMDCIDRVETQADFTADLLSLAVQYNENPQVIRALLDAALNSERGSVDEALLLDTAAAYNGNPEVMKVLLEVCLNPETKSIDLARLLYAAAGFNGNPEVIKVLLGAGADVNAREYGADTVLHLAAGSFQGNPEVIQVLLDAGADVNARSSEGRTPLHVAMGHGNAAVIKALLDAGADANAYDVRGWTPLHSAAYSQDTDTAVVQVLLDGGADINARNSYGETPLLLAIVIENLSVVQALRDNGASLGNGAGYDSSHEKCLIGTADWEWFDGYFWRDADPAQVQAKLECGADVNAWDSLNGYPLHSAAAYSDNPAVIQALLNAGANVGARDPRGITPLHSAATLNDNPAVIQALLDGGADIEAKISGDELPGSTPLHLAAAFNYNPETTRIRRDQLAGTPRPTSYYEDPAALQALLDAGADFNARDQFGQSPLHAAAALNSNSAVTTALLDAGAAPNVRDDLGLTPLHFAASSGYSEVIQALLDTGADVNARDSEGRTALHDAAAYSGTEVIQTLLNAGAAIDARNVVGETPLTVAIKHDNSPVVRVLQDNGASR